MNPSATASASPSVSPGMIAKKATCIAATTMKTRRGPNLSSEKPT